MCVCTRVSECAPASVRHVRLGPRGSRQSPTRRRKPDHLLSPGETKPQEGQRQGEAQRGVPPGGTPWVQAAPGGLAGPATVTEMIKEHLAVAMETLVLQDVARWPFPKISTSLRLPLPLVFSAGLW